MASIAERFIPSLAQLGALGAFLLVVLTLALLGAVLGGRKRRPEGDLVSGWAAVSVVFTLAGTASSVSFSHLTYAVLAAAAAALIRVLRRDGWSDDRAALRIVVISAPLILLVANMTASQWDEFTQWLPNARFVLEHDAFPHRALPASPSAFPAYPHGLTLIIYMTSRLAGGLVENAGALFNLALLLSFGLLIVRLIRQAAAQESGGDGWGWCALAALSVTALNPTFVAKVVFTAYGDTGTAVALGFAAVFAWLALNALARDDGADARALAWQVGLAATALVNVKQVNLVLFAALLAAALLVAWRDPQIPLRRALALLPRIVVLPLVVYAAWRIHVSLNITGGEFIIRPVSQWSFALLPDVVARMALIASKKGGYFGIMTVALVFGVRALWRPRGDFDRLAIITGSIFLFYNGFLLFSYITAFGADEARRAASYWRYNLHLGAVGLAFAAYGIALMWRRYLTPRLTAGARRALFRAAVVLAVALPVTLSHKVRFDAVPRYQYTRAVGADLARILQPGQRILLIDARDNGQYLVMLRYALSGTAQIVGEITAATRATPAASRALARKKRASHVWVRAPDAELARAFGIQMKPDSSYLLTRHGPGWSVTRSWPIGAGK